MVLHLIGHLQKNKAGKAVKIYDYIQTVDSLELAKKIQKKANEIKKTQKIYMQINIGNIKGRYGFKTREIYDAAKTINELENIGFFEYLESGRTCLIEWGEMIEELIDSEK